MNNYNYCALKRTLVSTAISTVIGIGVPVAAHADIYEFAYDNGGCSASPLTPCGGDGDGVFTMLDPSGSPLTNTSYPYYGDTTWGYGKRTQIGGTLTYNTATRVGAVTINPFDFFNGGPAIASNISFTKQVSSDLMLGTLKFDWGVDKNGNPNPTISVEIVWDGSGLFAALPMISVSDTIDRTNCSGGSLDGLCATPASNGINKGKLPIGPVPIATTSYNVDGVSNGVGTPTLGSDDGIGGSPMDNGPFVGFNANFDFLSLTLTSFTDTTPPTISMNAHVTPPGTSPLSLTLNTDTYTEPGATCTDAAPVGGNPAVNIGGDTVNTTIPGIYNVTYDCMDSSGNNAVQATREVIVCGPGAPCVALVGGSTVVQECSSTASYTDPGAICVDNTDGDIPVGGNGTDPGTFAVNTSGVDLSTLTMDTATWSCTDSDGNPTTLDRTVDVQDNTAPIITINGADPLTVVSSTPENFAAYADPGATATDSCDTTMIGINTTNPVDMIVPDAGPATLPYIVRYNALDASTNAAAEVTRTVNVVRSQPVITLVKNVITLNLGDTYVEPGMNVADEQDGPATDVVASGACIGVGSICSIDSSAVNTNVEGTYEVTYDVTDTNGNKATQKILTVTVGAFATSSNFSMLDPTGKVFGGTNDVVFDWPAASDVLGPAGDGVGGDQSSLNSDEIDYTNNLKFNMSITSAKPEDFFGAPWFAHHVRVFGEGTYSFEAKNSLCESKGPSPDTTANGLTKTTTPSADDINVTGCPGTGSPTSITMVVGPGQLGAHILFDYNGTFDIDVVNVWDIDGVWYDPDGSATAVNNLWKGDAIDDPSGNPPDELAPWKLVSRDVNSDGINGTPMVDGPFVNFYANFNAGGVAGVLTCDAPAILDTVKNLCVLSTSVADSTLEDDFLGATGWATLLGILPVLSLLRRRKSRQ